VFVAASTECFHHLPWQEAIEKLIDLEYTAVEIALHESGRHLRPTEVAADVEKAVRTCRDTHRLDISAYSVEIEAVGEEHYRQFTAICRLAKATKVVTVVIPPAENGTPFNEEIEHLRQLVAIASVEGVNVAMRNQVGCLSEDPNTVVTLCEHVKGLGITLDPSHYIYQAQRPVEYDHILKYVFNVHLRDTNKDQLQVRVGQGEVEYGKLVNQLGREKYQRALCVHQKEIEGVDHMGEMRKLRLLLESLL